ncbi:MAG: CD3072 family TudS-related putative desulfidase [Sedimentibacter sp.]|uniref:CD3072 family TudS-related putative desulfidase n=1 Tax=Sedimentibacter sp. TaxID=1960295 RepID=UPI00315890DA
MERSKRIVFVSHCVLNQNAVVYPLARAKGAYKDIVKELIDSDVGIHQLPCPECSHLGLKRKPMTKDEYDADDYRTLNRNFASDAVKEIKEYLSNDYEIAGIIGINESPTCGIEGEPGIFMEEFELLLKRAGIAVKMIDVPADYHDDTKSAKFIDELRSLLVR